MIDKNTLEKFRDLPTPFYYYDLDILNSTLTTLKTESLNSGFKIHYAVKANANPRILKIISSYGFGADCVSWNEIDAAIAAGFNPSEIVFAGVGKTDKEIEAAIRSGIFCFNCESIPEIEVINHIASLQSRNVRIALRINPLIEAHTHKYITTGIEESKFGIRTWELDEALNRLSSMNNLRLEGIHFHIGSQITRMAVFQSLCTHINEQQDWFASHNIDLKIINVGGGLGIDYEIDLAKETIVDLSTGVTTPCVFQYWNTTLNIVIPDNLFALENTKTVILVGNRAELTDVAPNSGSIQLAR